MNRPIAVLILLAVQLPVLGQSKSLSRGPHRMEITLERIEGSVWRAVDPGLVLSTDDRVRFRFRTNFDGYLYVMNYGTSGNYTLLFPREETGRQNNLRAGREYLVPATEAWFRIAGPPGYDIVYWLVSPVVLGGQEGKGPAYVPLPPPPKQKQPPENLIPRCDDTIFQARGTCIDSSAGPRKLSGKDALPENLAGVRGATSRELIIMRQQNQALLSSPVPLSGPVIYEFRLAHK
jgi:hypothetical protein